MSAVLPSARGAAAEHEAPLAQLDDALDVRGPVRPAPLEIVVGGGDRDAADDHGVTHPPAKGTTWPMKKSASSDAR